MTSLDNYLFHQSMAEIWAYIDMADLDYRTEGAKERMIRDRNKYDRESNRPEKKQEID